MRVLIVDDDVDMAEILTSVCESDGHQATACGSSLQALEVLGKGTVDLLITDIAMAPPDGLELVRRARALQPDLIAIAVTGYWGRYTLPEVLSTGALDLIFKPFRVEELRARLAMAAERRRMAIEEKGRAKRIAVALERVQVLLVSDSKTEVQSLCSSLGDGESGLFEVTHVTTLEEAMGRLGREGIDVILLDIAAPGSDVLAVVRRVRAAAPSVPLVLQTDFGDDRSVASRAIQAGAQACLPRNRHNDDPLPRALLHAIERQRLLVDSESIRQQQHQMREQLVLHELQLKDEFISHISHELRSPLTAIHQFSTIMMDELAGPLAADQKDAMRVILRNIHQLEAMIEDLLEVTRMQTGKLSIQLQSVMASEVVADSIDTVRGAAQAKDMQIICELADDLPTAYADPVRTRQILINLLANAIKFTPAGGAVTVRASRDGEGTHLRFEVTDTGCGMSGESAERIFERLYQVKDAVQAGRKGLGLGLFICKELVTQQGGSIGVTSAPGEGSAFFFTLPVFTRHTPLRTHEVMVKRDLLARVDGPDGPITSAPEGEPHG